MTGVYWACKKSFLRFLAARRTSDASASFTFVLLRAMNAHMFELTGLDVRATVRSSLVDLRPSVEREGEVGIGRNATAA